MQLAVEHNTLNTRLLHHAPRRG